MNILITGGASGLGEAITKRLAADAGNQVYFTYFRSKEKAGEIEKQFANTHAVYIDFKADDSIAELKKLISSWNIEVLVNNAISGHTKNHFHKIEPDYFMQSFQNNVVPALMVTAEAIRFFRKKKFGKIITILTSGLINTPPVGWSEYTANKAYLQTMSKSWATENAQFNITSNCISPAMMLTELNNDMDERYIEMAVDAHPLRKLLTAEEVADSVYFLCNATQQINGLNIVLNSGVNIQ